jgi:[ribosomal protein S18]-alanine N-acetyltransferase
MVNSSFTFARLSQEEAEAIAEWHYPEPYSFYDWSADVDDLQELLEAARRGDVYWGVHDEGGELIGHFSFKLAGGALEVGLGLRPDLTGQGLSADFLAAGLHFARGRFAPERFTLAVATFNERAITVYERAGFARGRVYVHSTNGAEWEFLEMSRRA